MSGNGNGNYEVPTRDLALYDPDLPDQTLLQLSEAARRAILESQMAMFEYAGAAYRRMARLTRATEVVEVELLDENQIKALTKPDQFELWKEMNKVMAQSVTNLQSFTKMVMEFNVLKKTLENLERIKEPTAHPLEVTGAQSPDLSQARGILKGRLEQIVRGKHEKGQFQPATED